MSLSKSKVRFVLCLWWLTRVWKEKLIWIFIRWKKSCEKIASRTLTFSILYIVQDSVVASLRLRVVFVRIIGFQHHIWPDVMQLQIFGIVRDLTKCFHMFFFCFWRGGAYGFFVAHFCLFINWNSFFLLFLGGVWVIWQAHNFGRKYFVWEKLFCVLETILWENLLVR